MLRVLPSILLVLISWLSSAQNRDYFFKYMPQAGEQIPSWAAEMYSPDPDVFAVDREYSTYYAKNPFKKNLHTQNYRHWRRAVQEYISAEGKIRLPSADEEKATVAHLKQQRLQAERSTNTWKSLGPIETYEPESLLPISWQANVYCLDQSISNPDVLLAGTESGGAFLSLDKGISWSLVSNSLEVSSVTAVQIHPANPALMLIAANRRIYKSSDSGENWEETLFIDGPGHEIRFHPENHDTVYCASEKGLFRSANAGNSWILVFPEKCWDIKFHPVNAAVVYLLKQSPAEKRAVFLISNDHGFSWEQKDQGWYVPESFASAEDGGGKIGVSPADPDRVYAALIGQSKAGDSGWIGIYRSNDRGESWHLPSGQIGGPYNAPNQHPWNVAAYSDGYHQGFYNFSLGVSHQNADRIWLGTIRLSQSNNGGQSFQSIGAANSQRHRLVHADVQHILVRGQDIWVATDGGVDYSKDELISHESRKRGIIGADFWGFGTGWNEDVLYGGKYHNGNGAYYQTYGEGNFLHVGGVEEPTGYVNPLDNRRVYYNRYWTNETASLKIPDALDGTVRTMPSMSLIPNESYVESSSSGIYFDPAYADHVLMGSGGTIWKSYNGGSQFVPLHTFGEGRVYEISVCRSNTEVMYAVYHEGGFWDWAALYRSEDGGITWARTTDVPGDRWRMEISVNPVDGNELWVACSRGANGAKVFYSKDGGQSWTNASSPLLNNQRMMDICFQAGTQQTVYLATNRNVFYWDSGEWILYSEGLPFALNALQLHPFYRDNKLRLSTYGRGIWEAPLVVASIPEAQPLTTNNKVFCSRDTIPFECHSVINHQNASWEWEFVPEPAFVSDLTARNPLVVFGQEGQYAVTLKIKDGNGYESTKTVQDMVSIFSFCDKDPYVGFAMELNEQGDYLQIEDLGFESNAFTISAWIRPRGIQNDYSSVFMNDDQTAGLNFRGGNNTLGYHWPGGAWWWDSGLSAAPDEWSHVVMVAQADGITVYLNGKSAHHAFSVSPVYFGAAKIGSYKAWGGRNMFGQLDEISIWNRSLSEEEVRLMRHLTLAEIQDQSLVAYYQFNEPEGLVNDRVGNAHGRMNRNAYRVISSAPVGPGRSDKIILNGNGTYTAESLGWAAELEKFNGQADGELIVTRIAASPDIYPNPEEIPSQYWIINHHGSPGINLNTLLLKPESGGEEITRGVLFSRVENAGDIVWYEECNGNSSGDYLLFEDDCALGLQSQYLLAGLELNTQTDHKQKLPELLLYPNPVIQGSTLYINNPATSSGRFLMFSASGKMVLDKVFENEEQLMINVTAVPAGVYFYRWQSASLISHGSVVIGGK